MTAFNPPQAERHARVKEILHRAAGLRSDERDALLGEECATDPELRAEVESLLGFHDATDSGVMRERGALGLGSEASALEPGHVHAGRYRIERVLGEGGVGRVYQAWDTLLELPVALKTLRVVSSAQHRRLLQEARLARLVTHPVACRVYDVGEHEGELFLTMEQVQGEDLASLLARQGRLSSLRVAELGLALCEGLAAAHDAGVLHRDLKPANVIVEPSGKVRIVDFGLAASRPQAAAAGLPMGSPAYMAPEQVPPGEEIGPPADLHGVGLILHEALTGRRTFEAPTAGELFEKLKHEVAPRPSSRADGVDPLLEAAVMQALEKDPRARPASARALAQSLRSSLESQLAGRAGPARAMLPRALTSFVGRDRELGQVRELLREPGLVTLVGPGGAGKSRLALAAAQSVAGSFPGGAALVELGGLSGDEDLPHEVARVLGLVEPGHQDVRLQLRQRLSDRTFLLVLDNCEHLAEAGAQLVARLLVDLPRLTVLATSRVPLAVAGERCVNVGPLPVPPEGADRPLEHDAVRLFVERASAVVPGFAPGPENLDAIVRLCRGLDGIPLALELAAARLRALSLDELVRRLDSRFDVLTGGDRSAPAHHRSLKALIDWSYDQLGEAERRLFRRLSVFAGSFALESAEAVCADEELATSRVVDLLAQLVDRSLVLVARRGGQVRYHLLETLRAYGRERLSEAGEGEELRRRHLRHVTEAVVTQSAALEDRARRPSSEALAEDLPDIRAALAFASTDAATARSGLRLASVVLRAAAHGARRAELRLPLEAMLAVEGLEDPRAESEARSFASQLAREAGDLEAAKVHAARALELGEAAEDLVLQSEALRSLAMVASIEEGIAPALRLSREALELARQSDQARQLVLCHVALGKLELMASDAERAREEFLRALHLLDRVPNLFYEAVVLGNLSAVELDRGEAEASRDYVRRSAAAAAELGDPPSLLRADVNAACGLGVAGDRSAAIAALEEAAARARDMAYAEAEAVCHAALCENRRAIDDVPGAWGSCRDGLALSRDFGWQPQTVDLIDDAGALAARAGRDAEAVRLLTAASRHRRRTGQRRRDGGAWIEQLLRELRGRLGEQSWGSARAEGRRLDPAETLSAALAVADAELRTPARG